MSSNDDFINGMIAAGLLGLAVYGGYTILKKLTRNQEQRLLEILGNDINALNAMYSNDVRQISYDGGDDENS